LIDGAPEIMQIAVDSDEDLVEVPLVTRPGSTQAKIVRETGAELQAPPPDDLVRDDHAALRQDQFDIPKAPPGWSTTPSDSVPVCVSGRRSPKAWRTSCSTGDGGSWRFGKGWIYIGKPVKSMPEPGTERAVVDRAANLEH